MKLVLSTQHKQQLFSALFVFLVTASATADDRPGGPPPMQLSDDQRNCLQQKVGKPGEGERPSRETMQAAMQACGIQPPERKKF